MKLLSLLLVLSACSSPSPEAVTNPTLTEPASEVRVVIDKDFAGIALGAGHSCVLRDNGQVYCWGRNDVGQVGPGGQGSIQPIAIKVPGIDKGVRIAAAEDSTCVLSADGGVQCWGAHYQGVQRIDGMQPDGAEMVMCSGQLQRYGCVLHHSGNVSCFGGLYLGDGPDRLLPSDSAVIIPELQHATDLACSLSVACAKTQGGDALCWGALEEEMPTSAVEEPKARPAWRTKEPPVSFPGPSTQIMAEGPIHRCSLDIHGLTRCSSESEQALGEQGVDGSIQGLQATLLAVGNEHACALDKHRGLVCWGSNEHAQLGVGWGKIIPTPTRVAEVQSPSGLASTRRFTQQAWRHLAATAKGLWGWGEGVSPTLLATGFPVSQVAFNGENVCAISKSKEIHCAPLSSARRPSEWVKLSRDPTRYVEITAGGHHFCARDTAGQAWCWGSNEKLALGIVSGNFDKDEDLIQNNPVLLSGLSGVEEIAAGDAHSCARLKEGYVLCWGKNNQGRLGDNSLRSRSQPKRVHGIQGATSVSVGKDSSCAVHSGGQVSCWGRRFGSGLVPKRQEGLAPATSVAVGCAHACSMSENGELWCWGNNSSGQLGTTPGLLTPTTVSGLPPVKKLTAGCNSTCAETREGAVYCWGLASEVVPTQQAFHSKPRPVTAPPLGWQ